MGYSDKRGPDDRISSEIKQFEEAVEALKKKIEQLEEEDKILKQSVEASLEKIADLSNVYKTQRDKLDSHLVERDAHHVAMISKKKV